MFKCVYLALLLIAATLSACSADEEKNLNTEEAKKIGFYETYNFDELQEVLQNVIKAEQNAVGEDKSVFKRFYTTDYGAIMGFASAADTAAVNRAFEQYGKEILPAYLRLAWTTEAESDGDLKGCYGLVALRAVNAEGEPSMTGESLIEASYSKEFGRYCLSLRFNNAGGKQFSYVTAQNTGRQLAITFDGKVLSTANVLAQVDGGCLQISGNFTEEEVRGFVDRLYGVTTK